MLFVVAAVYDRRDRRPQSAATGWICQMRPFRLARICAEWDRLLAPPFFLSRGLNISRLNQGFVTSVFSLLKNVLPHDPHPVSLPLNHPLPFPRARELFCGMFS